MDIEVARTFLAVVETGSFFEAARRIHVTQSAVSMRIRMLERQLGRQMFTRHRHGVTLTPAGVRFQRHARTLVRAWSQAKIDAAGPEQSEETLAIGAPPAVWESGLVEALPVLRRALPGTALRAAAVSHSEALRRLGAGTLDLAVLYGGGGGLGEVTLFEDEIVRVSSAPELSAPECSESALEIDWQVDFPEGAPDLPYAQGAAVRFTPDVPMLKYLLSTSTTAHLPRRLVGAELEAGRLRLVDGARRIRFQVRAVFAEEERNETPGRAAEVLREHFAAPS